MTGQDRPADAIVAAIRAQARPTGEPRATPRAAATVVLVRPGADGPEVLLTRRPASMAFAADLEVFPGGRVDDGDAEPGHPLADGLDQRAAAARLGGTLEPGVALAHHVAAVRETLEETGIRVRAGELVPLSRWVTPPELPRRFDAWFFAAAVPWDTEVAAAAGEVAAWRWLTPRAALAARSAGELAMLQPTVVTLAQLVDCSDLPAIRRAFRPGRARGRPRVRRVDRGLAHVEGRWAGGIPGRAAPGWLVGERDVVLVDPGDPTGTTAGAIGAALESAGAHLAGIALTELAPERHAGVEWYAAGTGLPVVAGLGAARAAPYPLTELAPGAAVPFGDVSLIVERVAGALGDARYRLPDGRRLRPAGA